MKNRIEISEDIVINKLPHKYLHKHYAWQEKFRHSWNPMCILCAANQIGKSSVLIQKAIDRCTEYSVNGVWQKYYKSFPKTRWYFYPTKDLCDAEFEDKWRKYMPDAEDNEDDMVYGWKKVMKNGDLHAIRWNTGANLYFKSYEQRQKRVQSQTVADIFADEEMPEEMYAELKSRTNAIRGTFNTVFTATQGLQLWNKALEQRGTKEETFKDALKMNVSLYDCLNYSDGSPSSVYDLAYVKKLEAQYPDPRERATRVHGRHFVTGNLLFPAFSSKNIIDYIPEDWGKDGNGNPIPNPEKFIVFSGTDGGSGGKKENSCSAHVMIAVHKSKKLAFCYRAWRGDHQRTTVIDTVNEWEKICYHPLTKNMFRGAVYDPAYPDFNDIIKRRFKDENRPMNFKIMGAAKDRKGNAEKVNALLKSKCILFIIPEEDKNSDMHKIIGEFNTVTEQTKKLKNQRDDLTDALKYVINHIDFDWKYIFKRAGDEGIISQIKQEIKRRVDEKKPQVGSLEYFERQRQQIYKANEARYYAPQKRYRTSYDDMV